MVMQPDSLYLDDLLRSWLRQLRRDKSPHTQRIYRTAVQSFIDFCAEAGVTAELTEANVNAWLDAHASDESSTVRLRLTCLKLFAKWLAAEEGFDAAPVLAVKPPKLDQRSVPDMSEGEILRMLKACDGTDLRDKRDKALIMLFTETGLRAAEMLALDVDDVDIDACVAHVRRGKGGKGRRVRFSTSAAATLDRYLRARHRAVPHPAQGPLWISRQGRLTYMGLVHALKGRASAAGVVGFHLHRLRHTSAVRWLRAGGSETGLMAHHGWKSRTMVDRYVKAASEQLAGEEFDRLGLGLTEL
jgi:integrase/recombinase XerD